MNTVLRLLALGGLVYGGFAVAYPDWVGTVWPAMTLAFIAGGAVGVFALHKMLDLTEGAAKWGIEAVFVVALVLWVGYTMPQQSGKSPLSQWAEGARPKQADAKRGFKRLGVDPDGAIAAKVVELFPR